MAQAKFIPIFTGTTGLRTDVDPVRLAFDPKTGITELARAVNVDVDDTGRVSRRLGYTRKSTTAGSSAYAEGELCYFVSGTSLLRLHLNYTTTVIRSDLTAGRRMSFWLIAGRVYYTNGVEKGYITGDTDHAWEAGEYNGIHTNRTFYDPPNGHLVSWFGGRALVAVNNVVFASEPSQYGRFDLAKCYRAEAERITMLRPLADGLLVGTEKVVAFWRGNEFLKLSRDVLANAGVVEGSDTWVQSEDLDPEVFNNWYTSRTVLFVSTLGIGAVNDSGRYVTVSARIDFPTSRLATGCVHDGQYVVLIQP